MCPNQNRNREDGNAYTTKMPRFCPKCDSVMYQEQNKWVCRSCEFRPEAAVSETNKKRYKTGRIFAAHIDRISSSGNGIVETTTGHINVGPVTQDSVGDEVKLRQVDSTFCYCLNGSARDRNYDSRFGELIGSSEFCDNCGSVTHELAGELECLSCGFDEIEADSEPLIDSDSKPEKEDDNQESLDQGDNDRSSPQEDSDGLGQLRERAEEDAVEEVPKEATTSSRETDQYSRSSKVKEYVNSRAGGVCEGCDEPAPFTSKTGEPYLHAHHIHELSEGGSDTPDTVIALCPNCHYRVHHGEDGGEYNQKLAEIVQNKEESIALQD